MLLQLLLIGKMLHFVPQYYEADCLSLLPGHYRLWAAFNVRLVRKTYFRKEILFYLILANSI